ncbi:MAG: glycosyltransferase [Clostridia bacterium]|nr:glycosyltransferase [Clostridia bacterium]
MVPIVSIIVPVYNVEKYVLRCLESLAAQTLRDIEVIIIDDGSTDSSGAICEEFAKKDSRFRLFWQENAGLAGARNTGLGLVRGKYVGFADSDDLVEPDMYETLVSAAEENGADIAVCGRTMFWEDGSEKTLFTLDAPQVFTPEEAVRRMLLWDGLDAAAWDKIYRAEMFQNVRYPGFYVSEDIPVTSELLSRANRIVHCGRPLYRYLQRQGSLSHIGFEEKTMGVYLFHMDVGLRMGKKFPELKVEGEYFFYKGMLVLLFRYAASGHDGKRPKRVFRTLRKNIFSLLKNPFLPKKYKLFALGAFFGLDRLALRVGKNAV